MTTVEREAWLAERRTGIGSSDAASVCGLPDAYGTPYSVAMDKLYGVRDESGTEAMMWGNVLEETIARRWAEVHDTAIEKGRLVRHPDSPWLLATIDYWREGGGILECKLVGHRAGWGAAGTDDIPPKFFAQVQHQMNVTGQGRAHVAALMGGVEFRSYVVHRDDALIAKMVEAEADLWAMIGRREVPPPDFTHPSTADIVARLHTAEAGKRIELAAGAEADRVAALAESYVKLGRSARLIERERVGVRAELEHAMGDAGLLVLPRISVARKRIARGGYTVQPSSYHRMDVKGVTDDDAG